jgi:uncharacterized protein GlcG (DUF336 family)
MPKPVFITRSAPRLTLQGARLVLAAAARRAVAFGVPMDLAVVDDAGHLIAFNRMDGAKLSSIDIAISKAWTAACTRRGTHEYAEIAGPGKPAFGINVGNAGHVVGGIGCSSGTAAQDREAAGAGIRALLARTRPRLVGSSGRRGPRRRAPHAPGPRLRRV